jgi:hypothetical protein
VALWLSLTHLFITNVVFSYSIARSCLRELMKKSIAHTEHITVSEQLGEARHSIIKTLHVELDESALQSSQSGVS